jgi:3-hydroxyacyl-[acyl-carrier-protein] dehydratase
METLDIHAIRATLPHRYPMLLVDRVLELEPGVRIKALKNVTINEPFFPGHFPHYPVMPGVLIVEALAQASAIVAYRGDADAMGGKKLFMFAGIDDARFKRQVVPGDTLIMHADLERAVRGIGRFRCRATVEDQLVCEAVLMAAVRDVPPAPPIAGL